MYVQERNATNRRFPMAKKYYQDREDREHESKGMKRGGRRSYSRKMNDDDYSGGHERFVTGHEPDIGRDDHAGMPKETVMSPYPPNRARRGGYLDDSMAEIDAIQVDSDHQVESHLSHQK